MINNKYKNLKKNILFLNWRCGTSCGTSVNALERCGALGGGGSGLGIAGAGLGPGKGNLSLLILCSLVWSRKKKN